MHYLYFLKSTKNKKIYVGCTSKELKERLKEHNRGSNKFTKYQGPWTLIYYEKYFCKEDALSREKFYKTGFGKQIKMAIIGLRSISSVG